MIRRARLRCTLWVQVARTSGPHQPLHYLWDTRWDKLLFTILYFFAEIPLGIPFWMSGQSVDVLDLFLNFIWNSCRLQSKSSSVLSLLCLPHYLHVAELSIGSNNYKLVLYEASFSDAISPCESYLGLYLESSQMPSPPWVWSDSSIPVSLFWSYIEHSLSSLRSYIEHSLSSLKSYLAQCWETFQLLSVPVNFIWPCTEDLLSSLATESNLVLYWWSSQ